jgi:hypothetical protein
MSVLFWLLVVIILLLVLALGKILVLISLL